MRKLNIESVQLNNFRFADNMVLISSSIEELHTVQSDLPDKSENTGQNISQD